MSKHTILDPGGNNIQRDMWHIDYPSPSDLELKIRKEVMARINKSLDIAMNGHCCDDIIEAMEDVRLMLNLLWGE